MSTDWFRSGLIVAVTAAAMSACMTAGEYVQRHRAEGTSVSIDLPLPALRAIVGSIDFSCRWSDGSREVLARAPKGPDAYELRFQTVEGLCEIGLSSEGAGRSAAKVLCAIPPGGPIAETDITNNRPTYEGQILDQISRAAAKAAIARGSAMPPPAPTAGHSPASDADTPTYRRAEDPERFAVVVGVENYKNLPPARFADRDAEAVRAHLTALGVPPRNLFFAEDDDATRATLVKALRRWLPERVSPKSTVFFYFSGHGSPDIASREAFLVPIDGDAEALADTAYPLRALYRDLSALKVRKVVVALDSCFSGAGGRSVLPDGARPLVTTIDRPEISAGLVSLTASRDDQISGTIDAQGHGAFTYYLLKGLNGAAAGPDGAVSLRGLYAYLKPKVEDAARQHNRDQTSTLSAGAPADADLKLR